MSLRTASRPAVAAPFGWREAGALDWLEARLGPATAAFSTRLGGVSEGAFRSLNLGILTDDDRGRVRENRLRLMAALGREAGSIVMGRQVHGTHVQIRETPQREGAPLAEADAQVASAAALTPLVLVADCVPVVIAAPEAVGVVHCGWRGIAGGIVERVLGVFGERGHSRLQVAVGPAIGPCCYEVGDDVREAFRAGGHAADVMPEGRLDLARAIRGDLERVGVPPTQIHACAVCTSCHPELFFSHRRDGVTGRQAGLAWLSS